MTEKRFENRLDKSNVKFNTLNPVWDNEKEDALNVFEMVECLNALYEENQQLSKDKQLAESELMTYKQRVTDELKMRYYLSNHKPVFKFMAKELDITLEGNLND